MLPPLPPLPLMLLLLLLLPPPGLLRLQGRRRPEAFDESQTSGTHS